MSVDFSQAESNDTTVSQECKESLEYEKNEWKNILQKLNDEYQGLKSQLIQREETIAKTDIPAEELEFFDQTFYRDYLQSVKNLCTKCERVIEDKEQKDFIIEKRRKYILNLIKK